MQIAPTKSALLEAKDERRVMVEGFRFLDEKRLLLAAEIVKLFDQRNLLLQEFGILTRQARTALADGVTRHGLQGLQLQPPMDRQNPSVKERERSFFGVSLVDDVRLYEAAPARIPSGVNPSPEARRCRLAFSELLSKSLKLAQISNNLHRLLLEYRRTDRRARALEDVILPELDDAIRHIDSQLEEMDQEEGVRVRLGRDSGY